MNPAHAHLVLNHLPVLGTLFALFVLAYAFAKRNEEIKKLGLWVVILTAMSAVPVYLTGEPAEERIEHLAGVSEETIEEHEEAALVAFIAVEILGVAGLAGIVLSRSSKPLPHWLAAVVVLLLIVVAGLMARTANLGGQIRHPEIQNGSAARSDHGGREVERD